MAEEPLVVLKHAAEGDALAWAAERIGELARGRVLDVGCGEGRFLPADGVGLDRDLERLRRARARSPYVVHADAHALPFRSASFDAAMANRMLNDAGAIDAVLAEIARVLRSGGALLVLTLAAREPSPLRRIHEEAEAALGLRRSRSRADDRLDEENGEARLLRFFPQVSVARFARSYRFDDPSAALDHYTRRYLLRRDRDAREASALFDHVRPAVVSALSEGPLEDVERAALFVARKELA